MKETCWQPCSAPSSREDGFPLPPAQASSRYSCASRDRELTLARSRLRSARLSGLLGIAFRRFELTVARL